MFLLIMFLSKTSGANFHRKAWNHAAEKYINGNGWTPEPKRHFQPTKEEK